MYHPADTGSIDDPNTEFIELTNIGSETVNLNLVQFTDGVTFTFPAYDLDPGARVLVVKDTRAFTARYGAGLPVAGQYGGSLSNGGERVELVDAVGRTILDFTYDDGWHRTTDGQGHSLEVKDAAATDLNDKDAWQASPEAGGTPGV
jgi:hypothetical protein